MKQRLAKALGSLALATGTILAVPSAASAEYIVQAEWQGPHDVTYQRTLNTENGAVAIWQLVKYTVCKNGKCTDKEVWILVSYSMPRTVESD